MALRVDGEASRAVKLEHLSPLSEAQGPKPQSIRWDLPTVTNDKMTSFFFFSSCFWLDLKLFIHLFTCSLVKSCAQGFC